MMNPFFQYTRIIAGIEYEVWGGINQGNDSDLLAIPLPDRILEKRDPPAPDRRPLLDDSPGSTAAVFDALRRGAWTRAQVMRLTGRSKTSVNNALRVLASRGQLQVRTVITNEGWRKVYTATEAA